MDISNSKQVSDVGIESLCCQVQIKDKADKAADEAAGVGPVGGVASMMGGDKTSSRVALHLIEQGSAVPAAPHHRITVQEDYGNSSNDNSVGCSALRNLNWKDFR